MATSKVSPSLSLASDIGMLLNELDWLMAGRLHILNVTWLTLPRFGGVAVLKGHTVW